MANAKRKCCGCKQRFTTETMLKMPVGYFHSIDCSYKYARLQQDKARAKQAAKAKRDKAEGEKVARAKHREDKERIKTIKEWYDQLQKLVNQYVLHIRDKDKPCCTCGKSLESVKYDAGHYRSRGSCPELRFELTNIHKQCSMNCNVIGSGMRAEYREFIAAKYGDNHLEWLDSKHELLKEKFPHYLNVKSEIVRYRKLIRENDLKPVA